MNDPDNPYAPPAAPVFLSHQPIECPLAGQALKYALIGIFCCGFVLGPLAIKRGLEAKRMIAMNPGMTGDGKATAAIVLGVIEIVLTLVGLYARMKAMAPPRHALGELT